MKDEIKNGEFWERYLDITDGDLRNTPRDFALSRKNDIKNIGFDTNNDFYILIIPFDPIKHIRDLNVSHRELLETMKIYSLF